MHSSNRAAKVNPAVTLILLFGIAVIAVLAFMMMSEDGTSLGGLEDGSQSSPEVVGGSIEDDPAQSGEERRIKVPVTSADEYGEAAAVAGLENLRGVVVDETGAPVMGAEVKAVRTKGYDDRVHPFDYRVHKTVSGADGCFLFKGIPLGHYALCATWNALAGKEEAFAATRRNHPEGRLKTYIIVMKQAGVIEGRVTTSDNEPVQGAMVLPVGMTASFTESDAQGRFSLNGIEAGMYTVVALAKEYAPASESRVITGKRDLELVLDSGGSICGRVLFNGRPRPGVKIAAEGGATQRMVTWETVSGEDGMYRMAGLEAASYNLHVVSDQFAAADRLYVEISHGETQWNMDFNLVELGGLAGRVVDEATGQPVKDAWITAFQAAAGARYYPFRENTPSFTQSFHLNNTRTDREGGFRLPSLAPTEFRIGVRSVDGHAAMLWEDGRIVQVVSGEGTDDIDFKLGKGAVLDVTLRMESGEPVEHAEIMIREDHAQRDLLGIVLVPPGDELGNGSYRVSGLSPVAYRVGAFKNPQEGHWETVSIEEGEAPTVLEIVLDSGRELFGKVVDLDGRGIAGAYIAFQGFCRCITDEKGSFKVSDAPSRINWVEVRANGYYREGLQDLQTVEGEEVVFTLEPIGKGHYLSGTLQNDLGEPLAGVMMKAWQKKGMGGVARTCKSGKDGRFDFDGLIEGPVKFILSTCKGSLDEESDQVEVDKKDLKIVLNRFARVKGRVQDASGGPVEAFTVRIKEKKERMGRVKASAESFYDEVFDLGNIPCGEVTLLASAPDGREGVTDPLTLAPGEVRDDVIIKLSDPCSISGKVFSKATAEPLAGATIHVDKPEEKNRMIFYSPDPKPKATTGDDGTFFVKNLKPGRVTVRASHKKFMDCELNDVQLVTGETTGGLELFMEEGGVIFGCVEVDGLPRAGVRVDTWGDKGGRREDVTDRNGMYRLDNLPPGSYMVSARIGDWGGDQRSLRRSVNLALQQEVVCDISIEQGGGIAGTTYVSGKPQRDVRINLSPVGRNEESRQTGSTTSGGNGAYEVNGLPPGKYRIHASFRSGTSNLSKNDEVEIIQGFTQLDIQLGAEGTGVVSGHVYMNDFPMAGQEVQCSVGGLSQRQDADENGFFQFTGLPAGQVRLMVYNHDWETGFRLHTSKNFELAEGEAAEADIYIRRGAGKVIGKVLCNGEPVDESDIHLSLKPEGSGESLRMYVRVANGAYCFENLPTGSGNITLSKPWQMNLVVEVVDGRETVADFSYEQGDAAIEGTVKVPESNEKKSYPYVFLFNQGACAFKTGEAFNFPYFSDGAFALLYADREGKIQRRDSLPAKTFDIAAVLVEDSKVAGFDVQRITLRDGETTQVVLDVSG